MPSSYTTNTGIEKPATGEQSGIWGETVNVNSDILDRALNGVGSISLAGTTHTLTTSDGSLSDGMYRVLVFGGSPSGTNTITIEPNDAQKLYFVVNNSGESIVMSQGSGTTVTVDTGETAIVYADGGGISANVSRVGNTTLTELGVTAVASELNILDGATVDTAEINYLDITTLGTSQASKTVTSDTDGVTTFAGGVIENAETVSSSANTTTIDCQSGNVFSHTLSEATEFVFSNPPASGSAYGFVLRLIQDLGGSGYTVTWPASVDWPGGLAPTISSIASSVDIFVFYTQDNGSIWYGFRSGASMQ